MKTRLLIPFLLVFGVAIAIAQQTSTSSSSSTKQGSTSGSASSSSTASGSASGSISVGGSASGSHSGSGGASMAFVKPTHAVLWSPGDKWVGDVPMDQQPGFFEHSQYLTRLARAGKITMSGPWRDEPGGLTLLYVRTDEEAERLVADSPMMKNGVLGAEVKAWTVLLVGTPQVTTGGGGNIRGSGGGN